MEQKENKFTDGKFYKKLLWTKEVMRDDYETLWKEKHNCHVIQFLVTCLYKKGWFSLIVESCAYENIKNEYIKCIDLNLVNLTDINNVYDYFTSFLTERNGDINPILTRERCGDDIAEVLFSYLGPDQNNIDEESKIFQKMILSYAIYYELNHFKEIDKEELLLMMIKKKCESKDC